MLTPIFYYSLDPLRAVIEAVICVIHVYSSGTPCVVPR